MKLALSWPIGLVCVFCLHEIVAVSKLRLCVVEGGKRIKRIREVCAKLNDSRSPVRCVTGSDRYNCIRQLATNNADFAVLEPEELIAASIYSEDNIVVTGDLRFDPKEKAMYEMVAIAQNGIHNLWDIKGKRFCHPGFDTTDDWSQTIAMYFEDWMILKECDLDKTLLENRLSDISNYFEAACIAGPWSSDLALDAKLKSKYRNLCSLCQNPSSCSADDKYYGRNGALLCIAENVADVAWVRLSDARNYFKLLGDPKESYNFLCPDGTLRPFSLMEATNPCVWITRPWPVVAAARDVGEQVLQLMRTFHSQANGSVWTNLLQEILTTYHVSVDPTWQDSVKSPEDYLRNFPGFLSANTRTQCQPSRTVKWCTSSHVEDRKCQWLQQAAVAYGVLPSIACVQHPTRQDCLNAVKTRHVDIFVALPQEELAAKRMGLKAILRAISNKREHLNKIVALVKKESTFKSLKSLKGSKACFPGYETVEWNTFVSLMRNQSQETIDCLDARFVAKFFQQICVFGDEKNELPRTLRTLCTRESEKDDESKTFECLTSGRADVAFVNLHELKKGVHNDGKSSNAEIEKDIFKSYKSLCVEENDFDESCILSWIELGSIVVNENVTGTREEEIFTMLMKLDELFGVSFKTQTPIFSLYGPYNSQPNIIFPEGTQYLQRESSHIKGAISYNDVIENLMKKVPCSVATNWRTNGAIFVISISIVIQYLANVSRNFGS